MKHPPDPFGKNQLFCEEAEAEGEGHQFFFTTGRKSASRNKGMLHTLKEKIATSKIEQLPRFQKITAPQQINVFTSGLLLRHGTYLKLRGKLFHDLNSAWNFLETDQEKIRHGFSGRPVRTYPMSENWV